LEIQRLDSVASTNELSLAIAFKAITLANIDQVTHGFMLAAKDDAAFLKHAVDRNKTTEGT